MDSKRFEALEQRVAVLEAEADVRRLQARYIVRL